MALLYPWYSSKAPPRPSTSLSNADFSQRNLSSSPPLPFLVSTTLSAAPPPYFCSSLSPLESYLLSIPRSAHESQGRHRGDLVPGGPVGYRRVTQGLRRGEAHPAAASRPRRHCAPGRRALTAGPSTPDYAGGSAAFTASQGARLRAPLF